MANGSNEVLQTLLLTYGGAGRTAAVWEPTYALHSHIARLTGTDRGRGRAGRRPVAPTSAEVAPRLRRARAPSVAFLCSPNNPTGMVDERGHGAARRWRWPSTADGLLVVDEAYGQFAPWSALGLVDDDVPLVVTRTFSKTWSMAAARLGYLVGPAWLVAELEKVVLPYHLDTAKQLAGRAGPRPRRRDGGPGGPPGRGAGPPGRAAWPSCPCDVWPSGANFVLFRPAGRGRRRRCGRRCSTARSWSATSRRAPRLEGCLRVTVGTPDEDDAFLDALDGDPHMTDRAAARPPRWPAPPTRPRSPSSSTSTARAGRGRRPGCRSSTTCSTSSAATAGST